MMATYRAPENSRLSADATFPPSAQSNVACQPAERAGIQLSSRRLSTRRYRCAAKPVCLALAVLALCLALASRHARAGPPLLAQAERRAALLVQFGDNTTVTRCVAFQDESISSLELLTGSGLDVRTWGGAVCRIEAEGCSYPASPCFCQCTGEPCLYWTYWHWSEGRWVYSQVGSADYRIRDGDLEGWLWGNPKNPPIVISFAEVCGPEAPVVYHVSSGDGQSASPSAAHLEDSSAPTNLPLQYAVFAGMAAMLLLGLWRLRRRQQA